MFDGILELVDLHFGWPTLVWIDLILIFVFTYLLLSLEDWVA